MTTLLESDISYFEVSKRCKNDSSNKKREAIICGIVNNKIPDEYYKNSDRWLNLLIEVSNFIKKLCYSSNIQTIDNIDCKAKAGRKHNYDFEITINGSNVFKIEFKFNACSVLDAPQFVSPMNPSQYLDGCYEEYYYDKYLVGGLEEFGIPCPLKEEYLNEIHNSNPSVVSEIQNKYYRGCKKSSRYSGDRDDIAFYDKMKALSKTSIESFISQYGLKTDVLSSYLLDSQKNKYYMLYKEGKINLETINPEDYIIMGVKGDGSRYLATTKSNKTLKILLRWKNGNGIAFPSFQIS